MANAKHTLYPSCRFHPSLGHDGYVVVDNEAEDEALQERDELLRDVPYNEAEVAEWREQNPKAPKFLKNAPPTRQVAAKKQREDEENKDEDEGDGDDAPKRKDFATKKEFDAATKAWKAK